MPSPTSFAGESAADKRARIGKALAGEGAAAAVLTTPESIAWLLNIRGGDVPHTPLPLSFAILRPDGTVTLFIDRRKLAPGLDRHLGNAVTIETPDRLGPALDALAEEGRVQVDPGDRGVLGLRPARQGGRADPPRRRPVPAAEGLQEPGRARRHPRRASPRRRRGHAASSRGWRARRRRASCSEIAASDRLEAFRREGNIFRDLSFPTISGAGSNGAIVHYRASPETEKLLEPGTLYLLDSGAQYLDGTTDITRTVAIGKPSAEMRESFTRVLKGHIALATARFPKGTTGAAARRARPPRAVAGRARLRPRHRPRRRQLSLGARRAAAHLEGAEPQPLLPGMIVSNEPGYYKTGAYGIRIENLVVVQPDENREAPSATCCASRR